MAYTHEIKFRLGDGSKYLDADIEVIAGELVYNFTGTSQPLDNKVIVDFLAFTDHVKIMAGKYGGIKEVSIIKKV